MTEQLTLTVYGSMLCIDCSEMTQRFGSLGVDYEFIDINDSMANLKAFLAFRDTSDVFAEVRAEHWVGIPYFVFSDGFTTLDIGEAERKLGFSD